MAVSLSLVASLAVPTACSDGRAVGGKAAVAGAGGDDTPSTGTGGSSGNGPSAGSSALGGSEAGGTDPGPGGAGGEGGCGLESCGPQPCAPGKAHCTASPSDVCETDTTTSAHCGSCEQTCKPGEVCSSGKCTLNCDQGKSLCTNADGTGCYDVQTDPDHCGAGCEACTTNDPNADTSCVKGVCKFPCKIGYQACGNQCVAKTDKNNCGSCGNVCLSSESCDGSTCHTKDGYVCANANECASGKCTTFYPDQDGDKHGVGAGAIKACGTEPPAGFVTNSDDCCDVGGDAVNIFPGQTKYFTAQATSCNKGWDYNCSNGIEKEATLLLKNCVPNVVGICPAQLAWSQDTVPNCGVSGSGSECLHGGEPSFCASVMPAARTQGCH